MWFSERKDVEMTTLDEIYSEGSCLIPVSGRYAVKMQISGKLETILEKKIVGLKGNNYLPVFGLRHFKIPFMAFTIKKDQNEVIFTYSNTILIDRLRHIDYGRWLGKIYWKGKFLDYFFLVKL